MILVDQINSLVDSIATSWSNGLNRTYPTATLYTSSGSSLTDASLSRVTSSTTTDPRTEATGMWNIDAGGGANELYDALSTPKQVGGSIINVDSGNGTLWKIALIGVAIFIAYKYFLK